MWRLAAVGLGVFVFALSGTPSAQAPRYSPPRLTQAELPGDAGPMTIGGGEVMIEFIVDGRGLVTRPAVVRSTPPYTEMVLASLSRWRFLPARAVDEFGSERAVEMPVTVSALYRPPTFYNGPTLGEPPRDVGKLSGDVAYPLSLVPPPYPPRAFSGSMVLYEIALNDTGGVLDARGFAPLGGFESAARESLSQMTFRGATYRARPVPSVTYVLFGFRQPLSFGPAAPTPPQPTPR